MRSTNVNNRNRNRGSRKLTIKTSAILAAIWAGLFGYEAFAGYMMAEQLFLLVALGLVAGTILTIATLLYGIKIAELVLRPGNPGTADSNVNTNVRTDVEVCEMEAPDELTPR